MANGPTALRAAALADYPKIEMSGFADYTDGYIAGAKYAAALTQELGEIYAQVSQLMTPAQIKKCQAIFAKNKEIVDE